MAPEAKLAPAPAHPAEAPCLSAWDILASLGEAMAVVDRSYRVVWAREPLLPRGHPGLKGRPCYQVFAGRDEICRPDCPVEPVWTTGRMHTVERHFLGPDGRPRWREARAYPIRDQSGRVVLVARLSFDISRRKEDEARQDRRSLDLARSLEELSRLSLGEAPFQGDLATPLSARELEVLRLLAQGLKKPQIATVLTLSPHTVKRHVDHIFSKLGVSDRAQAAVWAARQGLV